MSTLEQSYDEGRRDGAVEKLHNLKRWLGKERARCERIEKAAYLRGDLEERSRAYGEAVVLTLAMTKIDRMVLDLRKSSD